MQQFVPEYVLHHVVIAQPFQAVPVVLLCLDLDGVNELFGEP